MTDNHFPNPSKLSVALLEHIVKPVIGDKAIEIIKAPVAEKQIRESLAKALAHAEQRFVESHSDHDLCRAVLDLPLSDLPSLQSAINEFYQHPTNTSFAVLLRERLVRDFPKIAQERIDGAVSFYLTILREELTNVSPDIRSKLDSLSLLQIQENTKEMADALKKISAPFATEHEASPPISVESSRSMRRVEIILEGSLKEFNKTRQEDLVRVLAALLGIESDSIRVLQVREGSIVIELELPKTSASRLYQMFKRNDFRLKSLKVTGIKVVIGIGVEGIEEDQEEDQKEKNLPGGVQINAHTVNIIGDVIGRDKSFLSSSQISSPSLPSSWLHGHSFATSTNFVGRDEERKLLNDWIHNGPALLIIRALGGFGKSALAWQWLTNEAQAAGVKRAMWWSFYDDNTFENFLRDTLTAFGIEATQLNPRVQMETLISFLIQPNTLIVMDGFERALRAFSGMDAAYRGDDPDPHLAPPPSATSPMGEDGRGCVSPLAENFLRALASRPDIGSRILITTRLRPRVLDGHDKNLLQYCKEIELTALSPADAVTLFHALGVQGTRAEIEAAGAQYGHHPLSLRLLAGLIINDLRQPKDIKVAGRLDITGDLVQRQHHVLEQAYNSLTTERQQLLSRLACFRSPMSYEAMMAIMSNPPSPAKHPERSERASGRGDGGEDDLHDLLSRGLLHRDTQTNKYDLHPIVRRYAYDRLVDKSGTHSRLRDYFKAVEAPTKFKALSDLDPLIELYHHTVRAGQYDEARTLFRDRISQATYFQFGAYQLRIELLRALFPNGEDKPPRLKDESDQAWTLIALANSYSLNGQPRKAVPLYERQIAIREKQDVKKSVAIGLGAVSSVAYLPIGALRSAEANLRRAIELDREIQSESDEASDRRELGCVLAYRGEWDEAVKELTTALGMVEKQNNVQGQCIVWAYRALRELLMLRVITPTPTLPRFTGEGVAQRREGALNAARRALELADEDTRIRYPHPRDYVRAHWLLGAVHRVNKNYGDAERHLLEALTRCRGINMVDHEGNILIDLARLRLDLNEIEEAQRYVEEALTITERSGYVLQGADAHLVLAQLALKRNDKNEALHHAREARTLATCDGEPYVYRVAFDEAGALIKELEK